MLIPAVHFPNGTCAEAISFYQEVFNAKVISISYERDAPPDSEHAVSSAGKSRDNVMHAELIISGARVNMADGTEGILPGDMFLFNVFLDSAGEVAGAFDRLKEGGQVLTELGPQFWTPLYGAVKDRFGICWQIMANA